MTLAESFGKEARRYDLSLEYKVKDFEPQVNNLQTLRGEYEELTKALDHIDCEIAAAYRQMLEDFDVEDTVTSFAPDASSGYEGSFK